MLPATDSCASAVIVFLALSVLLHLVAVGWMNDTLPRMHDHMDVVSQAVETTLVTSSPPPKPKPAPPKPKRKPATKLKPMPPPEPTAPTPPSVEAPPATAAAMPQEPAYANGDNDTATAVDAGASSGIDAPAEPDYAIDLPPSARLEYDVRKTPVEGQSTYGSDSIAWRRDSNRYTVAGEFSVLFITALHFRSEGTIESSGIAPELYSEKHFRRAETNTHFHRKRNTISFSASTKIYPRTGTEQDRARILWQLGRYRPRYEARFVPGAVIEVIGGRPVRRRTLADPARRPRKL